MDPDPDPGGPKTCGSGGSGSGTLPNSRFKLRFTDDPLGIEVAIEAAWPVPLLPLGLGLAARPAHRLPLLRLLGRLAPRHLEGVDKLGTVQILLRGNSLIEIFFKKMFFAV